MNKKIIYLAVFTLALILGQTSFASSSSNQQTTTSSGTNNTNTNADNTTNSGTNNCAARLQKMIQTLNLNDTQQTKVKAIIAQAKADKAQYLQQMQTLHGQLKQLIIADTMDESQLDNLLNQKKELFAAILKIKIMAKYQIYQLLDAQQRIQFQQMMDQWAQNHGHS